MSAQMFHPFYIVDKSPWPLTGALSAFMLTSGMIMWFHSNNMNLYMLGLIATVLTMYQWWRDISLQGAPTSLVVTGLKWGIILFIVSEIFFFVSFFWAFFHEN